MTKVQSRSPRQFRPLSAIVIIENGRVSTVKAEAVSHTTVGWKAYGLAALPAPWTVQFFVISASCDDAFLGSIDFDAFLNECLGGINAQRDSVLMVRSSGVSETIMERGRLPTEQTTPAGVVNTIRKLRKQLDEEDGKEVHWVVQKFIAAKAAGFLSNERHARRDKRDWLLEVVPAGGSPGNESAIAVRRWRDGYDVTPEPLRCSFAMGISLALKPVTMWAEEFSHRTKFEWFWDGNTVQISQADIADPEQGLHPADLLKRPVPSVHFQHLERFRLVSPGDYSTLKKLRNAAMYETFGYRMPAFYLLDDRESLADIFRGVLSEELRHDLRELTKRPLMLRTDGASIPASKKEMLPRSDLLFTSEQAESWLLGGFRSKAAGLGSDSAVAIVAHNFIPSVASAWAWAAPNRALVRIESLWGIPEGLYWYSYDTFEVDTNSRSLPEVTSLRSLAYRHREHLRFKGTFVAPNVDGRFLPYSTSVPEDWSRSIRKKQWLSEIAYTTRRIAEAEKYPVAVMWLIDNHPTASEQRILPWYHSESDISGAVRVTPRNKTSRTADEVIATADDWKTLHLRLQDGAKIERVSVKPRDPDIIRNLVFVEALGHAAAEYGFVVELAGGILSHAYHVLRRCGARVEFIDLVGTDEDVVEFNKVVRDKIVDMIVEGGEKAEAIRLEGDALLAALKQKLVEEAFEALDSPSGEELVGELADVVEVIYGICHALGIGFKRVDADRVMKRKRRGGFESGLMLQTTSTPHSISLADSLKQAEEGVSGERLSERVVISNAADLPVTPLYRKPDLRRPHEMEVEKMFVVEVAINRLEEVQETLEFTLASQDSVSQEMALILEMRRIKGAIRAVVRLRAIATQLELKFEEKQLRLDLR